MYRSTQAESQYKKYKNENTDNKCPFCDLPKNQIVKRFKYFLVIKNRFPYSVWDTGEVKNHYMLVPKKHLSSISDFSKQEKAEYLQIIADYEAKGYDTFTRSSNNKGKTQPHFHTHLLKVTSKKYKFHIFNRKPYISYHIY